MKWKDVECALCLTDTPKLHLSEDPKNFRTQLLQEAESLNKELTITRLRLEYQHVKKAMPELPEDKEDLREPGRHSCQDGDSKEVTAELGVT